MARRITSKKFLIVTFAILSIGVCCCLFYKSGNIKNVYAETVAEPEEVYVDPTGRGDGYANILYDSTNGLPTSEANTIAETSDGFLWIGGYSGLVRYDGVNFERISQTVGISSVVSLYVDSKGRLWIGTNENGVAVYKNGEFTFFDHEDFVESSSIRSIVEDKNGNIYIATTHGMDVVGKDMKLRSVDAPEINEEYICELRIDPQGRIYGETVDGSVFTFEDGKVTGFYSGEELGAGYVRTILPDPEKPGFVYMGTDGSDLYYGTISDKMETPRKIDISPLSYVNSIEKINGSVWICANNGIGLLYNGVFMVLKDLPMDKSINHVLSDYEYNLWFTSSRQGLMKIVPNEFRDISARYDLENMVVNSTCIYNDTLLIGSDSGLKQVRLDEKGSKLVGLPIASCATSATEELVGDKHTLVELLENTRIRSIIKDSGGALWFSTYSDFGLVKYDVGEVTCFTADTGLPSNKIRTVSEKSDGSIMASCSGGLAVIKDDKVVELYDESAGLTNTEILSSCEGENGEMYLGSDGDGIYVVDKDGISNIGLDNGLKSEVILRIKRDDRNKVFWLITSNSIAYMKGGIVTTVEQFPYSNNFDMYENKKGDMWILSSNGIYVVKTQTLLDNKDIEYAFYDYSSGIPCVATANSYSCLDKTGDLYVSGSSGVFSVNVDKFSEKISDIKMSVPYVEADEDIIYADKDGKITIPSSVKRISIHPFVFTHTLKNPKITYSLIGFDNVETTVLRNNLNPVSYTNLGGGTYTFNMKLRSNVGGEEKSIAVIIEKEKAIYEYVWFKILLGVIGVMLIVGIVTLYFRKKTAALVKKQNENKLFIREMIEAFAKTIDMKDKYTNGHSARVAEYTAMLAEELGYDEEEVEKFYNIALLHDIGKIAIPPEVLNKPGKLTDQEFNIIKSHSAQGYKVLKDISIMPELAIGAGAHHERPDGKGYPKGLKGDEIPRVAQIIAVADTFDAMYSDRPYRKRMNFEKAVSIIKEVSGTQLFPDVVDAFVRLVEKGKFRAPDDEGGGSTEDINNIHKKQDKEAKKLEESKKQNKEEVILDKEKTVEKTEEKPEEKADEKTEEQEEETQEDKEEEKQVNKLRERLKKSNKE
ncbi:MAG: HD domain-containing protein [Eubacterium sp.]|nr:HD domain-containing protein [Eubacterium sp.]